MKRSKKIMLLITAVLLATLSVVGFTSSALNSTKKVPSSKKVYGKVNYVSSRDLYLKVKKNGSYHTINFLIKSSTKIVNKNNKPIASKELYRGKRVAVVYDGTLTKSNPPIGNAKKIIVLNVDRFDYRGRVVKVLKNSIIVKKTPATVSKVPIMRARKFFIHDYTTFVNKKNVQVSPSLIKVGSIVGVKYKGYNAKYYPPASNAVKIFLLKK